MGRQRRTSRLLQRSKSRACHAKARSPGGTPAAYITPLAEEQVTRLPRRGAEPRWDASGVHHASCRGASHAPATQRRGAQVGRQRRTSRLLQRSKSRACHAEARSPRWGRQRRTSRLLQRSKSRACHAEARSPGGTPAAYITPLAEEQVTRLPRRGAEPRWDASGVHHASCRGASHAPATQRRGAQVGRQRRTSRLLQRSKSRARHAEARSPGGTPAAYITPLAEEQVTRLPRRGAEPKVGRQRRTSRLLQRSKSRACHAEARSPGGTPAAYITPLAEEQVTRLPRRGAGAQVGRQRRTSRLLQRSKSRACPQRRGAQVGRQRRTSRLLQRSKSRRLPRRSAEPRWDASGVHHASCRGASHAPATQRRGAQVGRQRRTSRLLQRSKSRACHAEARSPGGTPAAYITLSCRGASHAPATQRRGAQVGRQRRTSRLLQRSKSRACHAEARSPGGTPAAYITPLAEEQVTRLPRRGAEPRWDASGVHHASCRGASHAPATQRRGAQVGRQRRTSRLLQRSKSRACHAEARSPGGTPAAYITPLAEEQVTRLPRRGAEPRWGRQRRTSRLLQRSKSRACQRRGAEPRWDASGVHHASCRGASSHAPATQKRGAQVGRQRRTSRPLQRSKSRACHAEARRRCLCVCVCECGCVCE